jgi:hypothetical protein
MIDENYWCGIIQFHKEDEKEIERYLESLS